MAKLDLFIEKILEKHEIILNTNCDSGIIITDIADHFGEFHVAYENTKVDNHPTYIQVRQLKKDNIQKLKNDLATADYSSVFVTKNPDDAYDIFYRYLYISV